MLLRFHEVFSDARAFIRFTQIIAGLDVGFSWFNSNVISLVRTAEPNLGSSVKLHIRAGQESTILQRHGIL